MSSSPETAPSDVSLESVLRTDELKTRPFRAPDCPGENRALLAIAQQMADSPRSTLQKLAEVAMEICGAGSAGVSLVSEKDGNFYWPAIAGAWTPYIGGGTPRHFGPCGVVLDRNAGQLFSRPERYYPYLVPVDPPIEEALLTPFYVEGKAVGTVWVVAHNTHRKFDGEDMRLIENLGRLAAAGYPLWAALESQKQQSESMREVNEALLISSLRQHELTEQAEQAETASRESEDRMSVELAATQQLQEISTQLVAEGNVAALYEQILDTAAAVMHSDFASLQMFHPERGPGGELGLLGYRGFDAQVAHFWEWVRPTSQSSYGMALRTAQRVVIPDVQTSDLMAGTEDLAICLQTGIRSVQSTPLVSRSGKLLGLLSTHWRQPHSPPEQDLRLMDVLARLAADLIERSQADKVLQDLNADLKHFSYATSHDLQGPLRIVMSCSELLARNYKGRLDAQADQLIDYAVNGAHQIEALLRGLREYWSVNEKTIENVGPIECNGVLEKALEYLHAPLEESGAIVTYDSLPTVMAEEFPLTLLFQNLIGNAIKYRRSEAGLRIHLSAEREGGSWRISVADNGMGIEAEYLQTIFVPFKRLHGTEIAGTGLGLAMCQRVVERYRGEIWAESSYGQGSTFRFTLPAMSG